MNVTGVTSTAPAMPVSQIQNQIQEQVQALDQTSAPVAADAISASVAASVKVMDLAQSAFEDAAAQLIASMTGVGQNFDMTV